MLRRPNQLFNVDDLFVGEQILVGLAEENIFFHNINRYISFAKESKEGRQVFMKLIRSL